MGHLNQISAFLTFMLIVHSIKCADDLTDMGKKCRGVNIDITEDHVMHMNDCLKEAGAKEVLDIMPDKMPCFGKCVFAKKGLIDANGKPHKEKIKGLITERLPKEVHAELDRKITACLNPETMDTIDKDDESCVTYVPVLMCIHIAFIEECEV